MANPATHPSTMSESDLQKIDLSMQLLRAGHPITIRVSGMSMLPALWPGDRITIQGQTPKSIRLGDIILWRTENRFILHRLICRRTANLLTTRGDSNPRRDKTINEREVLGRVSAVYRNGRSIAMKSQTSPVVRAIGLVFCYFPKVRSVALQIYALKA